MLCLACAVQAPAAPSVALYYGAAAPLAELKAFDIVVVEPDHGYSPAAYRRADSELYAYVSVGEVHPSRPYFMQLPAEARLAVNAAWGSVVVDQSRPAWPDFFAERVVAPLWQAGYRGFFLDTLDSYRLAGKFDEAAQQRGLVAVIETLHRRFPGIRLILNRGFDIVPAVRDKVQMVAAESLFRGWDAQARRYVEVKAEDREWLLGQLLKIRDQYGIPVLAIDYVAPGERELARATAARIKALGIVPWVTDARLESIGVGRLEIMPRRILALYDGREAPAVNFALIHRFAEMPLNHLGYVCDYIDINGPLPEGVLADRAAGIVVWVREPAAEAERLATWLQRRLGEGLKLAVFGTFPLPAGEATRRAFGVQAAPPARAGLRVVRRDAMLGFEAPPLPNRQDLQPLSLAEGHGEALLEIADAAGNRYHGAAITAWGGFALAPFDLVDVPGNDQYRWVVDPFAFLARALRLPAMPVPDATTENGRRLMFVHIDGDGFPSRAELPGTPLAGRALLEQILLRYQLPATVSVIEAEVAPHGLYPALAGEMEDIARRIFALPYVDIASHSYSHPFRWDENLRHGVFAADGEAAYHLRIPGYDRIDLRREIVGSRDYIRERLAPPGKPVRIMLWSGDTAPGIEALRIAGEAGLLNMNGGDTAIRRANPSLTAVSAIGLAKGAYRQIYAPIANENIYTNLWRGPFYGYERVIETLQMTERPRRLKPIDLYFHLYSASKRASLAALHKAFAWALAQPVQLVHAADYMGKALDFYTAVIARDGDDWLFRGEGELRTLRVPRAFGSPDPAASAGLAGFSEGEEGRYLHLSGSSARLHFTTTPAPRPYLREANARLASWESDQDGLRFSLRGHRPLEFSLAHAADCRVRADGRPLALRLAGKVASFRLDHAAATLEVSCRGR